MTSSARDLRYGRRGGRWAEGWSDEDEARYQAAKTATDATADAGDEQLGLFDAENEAAQ